MATRTKLSSWFFCTGLLLLNFVLARRNAVDRARELAGSKGIVNLGAGYGRTPESTDICLMPEVVLNVDIAYEPDCPRFYPADLEKPLPFEDKQFAVAFASHVLEHLENWKLALSEWQRIADHVVIVIPFPFSPLNLFNPEHKQWFTDIDKLRKDYPGVEFYW